jgi:hypothetical protein
MTIVAQLSPTQQRWRGRIETGIRFAAPLLDLVLAAGDRLSRVVDREDPEPLPLRRLNHDPQRALADGRH